MARFRLRFLLQEFDLPRGVTLIGRGLDCHVTIEDPLVSRQHARVIIDDDGARVEDLGSRNGVKLNGQTVRGVAPIQDGDRLRIGTQDFVFCKVDGGAQGHARTTGVLRLCAGCKLPYPRELAACPNCESTETVADETLSGKYSAERRLTWQVELALEAFERALALGRTADAERILRRSVTDVDQLISAGDAMTADRLEPLALAAGRLALLLEGPEWIVWAIAAHARANLVPTPRFAEWLQVRHASVNDPTVQAALLDLVEKLSSMTQSEEDQQVFAGLSRFASAIRASAGSGRVPGLHSPSERTAQWVDPDGEEGDR